MTTFESFFFYIIPVGISFGLTLILTWYVRGLATQLQIVDVPNSPRKIHKKPIPLWGGLALFIVMIVMVVTFWQASWLTSDRIVLNDILGFLIGSVIILVGGLLDDKFNLKPWQSFLWPLLAVVVVLFSGLRVEYITNPTGGVINLWPVFGIVVTAVWLLGMTYTTKVLDGLDGLVSGIGAIGALVIFIVSLSWNEPYSAVSVLALTMVGICLGFLVFNYHPASIFLGEAGSLLIGFWLGMLSIIAGSKIATTLLIMGIPILDVAWVIIRRTIFEHQSLAQADRKHLHFRLLDLGWSQQRVVMFLYFLTILFGSVALWQHTVGKLIALGILVIVMIIIGFMLVQKNAYDATRK